MDTRGTGTLASPPCPPPRITRRTGTLARPAIGRTKKVSGTGTVTRYYEYGVESDGSQWTKVYTGSQTNQSPAWSLTVADALGRTVREERPAFGGGVVTNLHVYDAQGRLAAQVSSLGLPSAVTNLFAYGPMGAQEARCLDLDGDGVWDEGTDRIGSNATRYVSDAS